MSAEAAEKTKGPGIVLQPEEGQSYWQPIWANGYSIVKLSPKHAGPDNLTSTRLPASDTRSSMMAPMS